MRSRLPLSLLLLLIAAGPPDQPGTAAQATQALEKAEASRRAALAAEQAAGQAATAAAAERERLTAARVAAAERLRLAETAIEEMALRLDQLGRQRDKAEAALAARARAFAPLLPLIERLSLYPAETLLAAPASPEDAVRGVLVLQGIAGEIERQAAELSGEEARVAGMSAVIAAQSDVLKVAEAGQAAEAAALDREIAAAGTSEAQARGTEAAAAAAAAREAARAKTLHGVLASVEVAARRAQQAAAQQAAAQAAKARSREQVALVRPVPSPPAAARPNGAAGGAPGGAPVAGVLVGFYGAPTPAGPATGIRYQTAPGAHVLAPCGGTVSSRHPSAATASW